MGKKKPEEHVVQKAVFACGCFWSKEYWFSQVDGVISTRVGYTGGRTEHPTYKEVCKKKTGHAEAVEVIFNPSIASFEKLSRLFFELHNPSIDRRGKGGQYRSAIFYQNEEQKAIAQQLIDELESDGRVVYTQLEPADVFWTAEARHQKYCDSRGIVPKSYGKKKSSLSA